MNNKYDIKVSANSIKLYINELLHLYIKKDDLTGLQSWIEGSDKQSFHIEFYTKNGEIECVYDSKEKWENILKLINKNT